MASQALYRKWRSRTFDEVVGQQHVTQTLLNALQLGRVAHAYLFSGPRGTGKTSTARLLAKAVNCQAENMAERPCNHCHICTAINEGRLLDLIEIDAASNTGVDDIRDLREKVNFRPSEARIKFYIIDEVHMLSNSAFNALLKTLEEPPEHVIFVLATTEPEKIPATITSRCQRFDFKRIKLEDIVGRLSYIIEEEGVRAEPEALEYIARQGSGSMRDAISLLDQLTAYGSGHITLDLVQTVLGAVASQSVMALVEALVTRDVAAGLDVINRIVADGADPRQLAREVVEYLRAMMLIKLGNGAGLLNLPAETVATMQMQAAKVEAQVIVRATSLFNAALLDIKSGLLTIPQLPLELAFVEAITPGGDASPHLTEPAGMMGSTGGKFSGPVSDTELPLKPVKAVDSGAVAVPSTKEPVTVDTVRRSFEQVLSEVEKKNKLMAEALRTQTRLHLVTGNEIHFITVDMLKTRFEKPQPSAALNEAFSQVIGQPVVVRFLSDRTTTVSGASAETDGEDDESIALLKVVQELGGEIAE